MGNENGGGVSVFNLTVLSQFEKIIEYLVTSPVRVQDKFNFIST